MRIKPLVALVAASLACWNTASFASGSGLVISQVYGGGGATTGSPTYKVDWVELFNAGSAPVDLTGLSLQYGSSTGNFGASSGNVAALPSDTLQPGQYYLVAMNATTTVGADLPLTADSTGYAVAMSATAGKIALVTGTTALACGGASACDTTQAARFIDLIGYGTGSSANRAETSPTAALSNTSGAVRKLGGCTDSDNNLNDFTVQSAPVPRNSASTLNVCSSGGNQPVVSTCPSSLAVTLGSAGSATLTARDADGIVNSVAFVTAPATGITLGTLTPANAVDGTASVTLNVDSTLTAGTYPAQVVFSNADATPQTASCTVNISVQAANSGSYTPIYQIQGSGSTSPLSGQSVTTQGVITKITNAGYFIQDATGDGNAATSDGIYVYTSTAPSGVSVGDKVQLTATVKEYNTGTTSNSVTTAHTVTELTSPTSVSVLSSGNTIAPTVITLPLASDADFERLEGMLVTINSPLTVSQNYFLGRYGQLTLSASGRLVKPTNVLRPGSAAQAMAASNALRTILLDDGTSVQNPDPTPYIAADNTVRAGDTVASITGVIDYGLATSSTAGFGLYKIHPTSTVSFTRANARSTTPPAVGGNVKVASANLLNFFTTFSDGTAAAGGSGQGCSLGSAVSAANCRGADSAAEFTRQRTKLIEELSAINADVFGLMEVQNNGTVALQSLIDGLNDKLGAGTYAIVPEASTGVGTDAIKTAIIYKPASVTRVGASLSDADSSHKRLPQAQTFALVSNGEKFSVVVNHFKSKGSCPSTSASSDPDQDQSDGQGCWNATRLQEAQALRSFVTNTLIPAAGSDRVLLVGDFNAYGQEDPVNDLATNGYTSLAPRFAASAADAYSYVFDGEAGAIDHALATSSLNSRVTSAIEWHVNADEPSIIDYNLEFKKPACTTCGPDYYTATTYRASDHDPLVIGLNLAPLVAQSLSFPALANVVIGAADFDASTTASSGLTVSYSASPASVCTVSGSAVHLVGGGTCTVTASQAGDATYAAATSMSQSFSVLFGQTITFNAIPAQTLGTGSVALQATSSAGLTLSYSSSTPAVCAVSGSALTLVSSGTCTITASQAGNGSYAAATSVSQSFTVSTAVASNDDGSADTPIGPFWLLVQGLGLLGGASWFKRRRAA
jgi:predicted extracellular nuclease